jgi:protein-S-isoprenylcysteine O-methyltransferase Ste14
MSSAYDAELVLAAACCASFMWAVPAHFRKSGQMPLGMRLLSLLTIGGFAWLLYDGVRNALSPDPASREPGWPGLSVAALCCLASLTLFWWSVQANKRHPLTLAFSADEPAFVQTRGPYHYVRHPFYLSYLLFWFGTAFLFAGLSHWVMPVTMAVLYVVAARREELKFMNSSLAASYAEYRARTGVLLPRIHRHGGSI